ncbi:ABC transporter ATP-binding protein, partial [Marisediminicola senii]|uniref:ABC transporter ATP-binding protein n=1 Tax=Marisediminicola senii TaxID=2711233 RepID=UPI0013EA0B8E
MDTPSAPLLRVRDLAVSFRTTGGMVEAVRGVSFDIPHGETLAIVGESGSGKSTTAMAVIGLLPGNGVITGGSVEFTGHELIGMPESGMRAIRGAEIGLVPQDPMSNLNPVSKIGTQVAETLLVHGKATRRTVDQKVVEVLTAAGLPNAAERANQYPHEFSGGMRQRALIAIGMACSPKLLIADEPTSALDVTVQRTILDQIDRMTAEHGTSMLLITHDLGLAAERASQLVVMNKGLIVESGPAQRLLTDPQDPYTKALVAAAPSVAAVRARAGGAIVGFRGAGGGDVVGGGAGGDGVAAAAASTPAPASASAARVAGTTGGTATTADRTADIVGVRGLAKGDPGRGGRGG